MEIAPFIRPPRFEIARTAPISARTKPAIPRGGVWEMRPAKRTKIPSTMRPKPATTRERLGVLPLKV